MPFRPRDPDGESSPKRHAPATLRNRRPILRVLARFLPATGTVLEIASGTGEHAVYFGRRLRNLVWQPSDHAPELLASIAAWVEDAELENVPPPLTLDVRDDPWPVERADAIFCANMIHIAPPEATEGLLRGAARVLPPGGRLILYGPFREHGAHTSESNRRFDEKLRSQDPTWGVRDRFEVAEAAQAHGLLQEEVVPMPAHNLILVFQKEEP